MLNNLSGKFWFKSVAVVVIAAFIGMIPVQSGYAQVVLSLPAAGEMIHPTAAFQPAAMAGLRVDLKDPFNFYFVMNKGGQELAADDRKAEYQKLIKYFLTSLTTPNQDMWVNLSPNEADRILPANFAKTAMGRDLLAQDYILKQLTASLMYPEDDPGKAFWQKVYRQAYEKFGTTDIPVDSFNKVWIMADKAEIYQKDDTALLVNSHLKVMLDEDYLSSAHAATLNADDSHALVAQVMRDVIVPAIEKEVNEGATFAMVRQVYASMIMATWFKKALKESLLGQVYVNKDKSRGIAVDDPKAREKIYQQYLAAYKTGVYNYIKEEADPLTHESVPRKYFSGGLVPVKDTTNVSREVAQGSFSQKTLSFDSVKTRLLTLAATGLLAFSAQANIEDAPFNNLTLAEKIPQGTNVTDADFELLRSSLSADQQALDAVGVSSNKIELERSELLLQEFLLTRDVSKAGAMIPSSQLELAKQCKDVSTALKVAVRDLDQKAADLEVATNNFRKLSIEFLAISKELDAEDFKAKRNGAGAVLAGIMALLGMGAAIKYRKQLQEVTVRLEDALEHEQYLERQISRLKKEISEKVAVVKKIIEPVKNAEPVPAAAQPLPAVVAEPPLEHPVNIEAQAADQVREMENQVGMVARTLKFSFVLFIAQGRSDDGKFLDDVEKMSQEVTLNRVLRSAMMQFAKQSYVSRLAVLKSLLLQVMKDKTLLPGPRNFEIKLFTRIIGAVEESAYGHTKAAVNHTPKENALMMVELAVSNLFDRELRLISLASPDMMGLDVKSMSGLVRDVHVRFAVREFMFMSPDLRIKALEEIIARVHDGKGKALPEQLPALKERETSLRAKLEILKQVRVVKAAVAPKAEDNVASEAPVKPKTVITDEQRAQVKLALQNLYLEEVSALGNGSADVTKIISAKVEKVGEAVKVFAALTQADRIKVVEEIIQQVEAPGSLVGGKVSKSGQIMLRDLSPKLEALKKAGVGGIDLNDEHMTILIRMADNGMPLPVEMQDPAMMNIQGLAPEIREISPVTFANIPVLSELLQ